MILKMLQPGIGEESPRSSLGPFLFEIITFENAPKIPANIKRAGVVKVIDPTHE
jgi:hypothetical protein